MSPGDPAPRTRSTADERREALIQAAIPAFAMTGLHGTAVSEITKQVGITQPYAFSLFGTKKELFLAACERSHDAIERTFREAAAAAAPGEEQEAMGAAYVGLLANRELLLLQLQSYAACGDPEIRAVVSRRYRRIYRLVAELTGAPPEELLEFMAKGMLLNVAAAIQAPLMAQDAHAWLMSADV